MSFQRIVHIIKMSSESRQVVMVVILRGLGFNSMHKSNCENLPHRHLKQAKQAIRIKELKDKVSKLSASELSQIRRYRLHTSASLVNMQNLPTIFLCTPF